MFQILIITRMRGEAIATSVASFPTKESAEKAINQIRADQSVYYSTDVTRMY